MSVISPNMNLIISTIAVDSGLAWEQNLGASLVTIDQHNHTAGNGVQIPSTGLNINANLTFNNNQITNLAAALFTNQTSLATLNALYTVEGELWFNDPTGAVQITAGGSVNATTSGISSGTATASFTGSGPYTLVVNSDTLTPANIQVASVVLGNNIASSHYVTLSPKSSLVASYNLVLPLVPASLSFLQLDSSGNITPGPTLSAGLTSANLSATANILGSQLSASANIVGTQLTNQTLTALQIANQTITATQVANSTLTGTQMASNNNLPGKIVQEAGKNLIVSNTNSNTNSLAIIRTQFNSSGSAAIGEGAMGVHTSTGVYTITWSTAFGDTPVVVATLLANPGQIVTTSASTTGCVVGTWNTSGATPTDAGFSIIAIGARS